MEDVEDRSIREVDDLPIPWCAYSSVPKVFLSLWVLQGVRPVGKTPVMAVVLVKMPVDSTQPTSGLSQSLIARTHCRGHGETILVDGDLHDIVPDETVGAAVPDHEMVLRHAKYFVLSAVQLSRHYSCQHRSPHSIVPSGEARLRIAQMIGPRW
jgi:hypothetical protein